MDILAESILAAVKLLLTWDVEVMAIVWVTLKVSLVSTLFAGLAGVPLGFSIAFGNWPGKGMAVTVLNTLLALPTVIIGLFVYSFISRRGLFGHLDLLYTTTAIIIGQVILIIPLVAAFSLAAISRIDERYRKTALTLGANRRQTAWVILREARFGIVSALIAAFGRVISEIGVSMMLGGNVKGFTRTITTAMALEYDKGSFTLAVALGMVLLGISFGLNCFFHFFQGKARA